MLKKPAEEINPSGAANTTDRWTANYQSYLVRVWREADDAPWRASLTHIPSQEVCPFGTVQALFLYLQERLNQ